MKIASYATEQRVFIVNSQPVDSCVMFMYITVITVVISAEEGLVSFNFYLKVYYLCCR